MIRSRGLKLVSAVVITCLCYSILRSTKSYLRPPSDPFLDTSKLIHWEKRPERYPVTSFVSLPTETPAVIPNIQHNFDREESREERNERLRRRNAIKTTFVRCWQGYKKFAWRKDELAPLTQTWRSTYAGWGATLVDSMDTLWLMGLKEDFKEAVNAVKGIDFSTSQEEILNVFEVTIRYLGGLLAAYDLSEGQYPVLLQKARELADLLYAAFDSPHRMPLMRWKWRRSAVGEELPIPESTLLAEFGSLSLEFTRLAQLTGNNKYYDAVRRLMIELHDLQNTTTVPGLWPYVLNVSGWPPTVTSNRFSLGGMSDSTYEYLPKQYLLLSGKGEDASRLQRMYERSIEAIKEHMLYQPLIPGRKDLLLSGNLVSPIGGALTFEPQGQHLTCFAGGMVAIGAKIFHRPEEAEVARRLVEGCTWAYEVTPSGLMPESFHTVPCHIGVSQASGTDCEWNESRWQDQVQYRQNIRSSSPAERSARVAELNKTKPLFPGFSAIGDRSYTLR